MPALLSKAFRTSALEAEDRSGAAASVLAHLEHSVGQAPGKISHREFRQLVQQRAQTTEDQVWAPVRVAVRGRGGW
jgi:hypothetical protein